MICGTVTYVKPKQKAWSHTGYLGNMPLTLAFFFFLQFLLLLFLLRGDRLSQTANAQALLKLSGANEKEARNMQQTRLGVY